MYDALLGQEPPPTKGEPLYKVALDHHCLPMSRHLQNDHPCLPKTGMDHPCLPQSRHLRKEPWTTSDPVWWSIVFTLFGGPLCLPRLVIHRVYPIRWSIVFTRFGSPLCLPHLVVLCVYPVWWSILFTRLVVHCVYPIWWSIVFIPFGGPLCLPHLAIQQRLERRGLNAFAIQQRLERRACNHGRNCPPSKPTSGHSKL